MTASDDVYVSLSSSSNAHLHEAGSAGTTGNFNLDCVSYDAGGLSSYTRDETQQALSRQTTVSVTSKPANQDLLATLKTLALSRLGLASTSNSTTSLLSVSDLNSNTTTTLTSTGLYSWTAGDSGKYSNGSYTLSSMVLQQRATVHQDSEAVCLATSSTSGNNGLHNGLGVSLETQTGSLSDQLTIYQAGTAGPTGFNLSSFQLTATTYSGSTVALSQKSTDSVSGSISDASGTVPSNYKGLSTSSLIQNSTQSQSAALDEKGTFGNGSLQLGLVSMTLDGQFTSSSRSSSSNSYTEGNDSTSVTANSSGNYHLQAAGSFSHGSLALSCLSYNGKSGGMATMTQLGNAAGANYSHTDNWKENFSLNEQGSYNPAAATGNGWSLSSYVSKYKQTETAADKIKNSTASTNNSSTTTVTGTGTVGNSVSNSSGSNNWNGRKSSYVNPSTTTVTLTGPGLAVTNPAVAVSGFTAAVGGWAQGVLAGQLLGVTLPATLPALAGSGNAPLSVPPQLSLVAPPLLAGVQPDPYGGWLTVQQGPTSNPSPWNDLGQTGQNLWDLVNKAYQDGLSKLQSLQQNQNANPLSMYSSQMWTALVDALPNGVEITYNWKAYVGAVFDFVGGALSALTNGLTDRALRGAGLSWLVNPDSTAYRVGTYVGQALDIVLTFTPVGRVLGIIQMAGGLWNSYDAYQAGDYAGAALGAVQALALGLKGVSRCAATQWRQKTFGKLGVGVSNLAGKTAGVLSTGLGVASTGLTLYSVYNNFTSPNGDPIKGLLDLAQAGVTFQAQVARSCFTGRMLMRTAAGKKRVDAIREGDLVWSRDENDPYGKLMLKEVQHVFVRVAPIWAVKIPGQTIETTAEHPFWVYGRGWIPTRMLEVGDLFLTDDGLLVTVEGVEDTGRVETVYNFLVEDFHTYFVSATEEGASVWRIMLARTPQKVAARLATLVAHLGNEMVSVGSI